MMRVTRYQDGKTKEVFYTLRPDEVRIAVDQLFIDSMNPKELEATEEEVVRKLFYKLYSQLQQMHKKGELPRLHFAGGGTE